MNDSYNKIMELAGNADLKKVVSRWEKLALNLEKTASASIQVTMPNMLWHSRSGVGQTTMLGYIADYLRERHLIEFKGDVDFIEFILKREGEERSFNELVRLDSALNSVSGHHNVFKGIVCIDITDWAEKLSDSRFASFLEYIKAHDGDWLTILTANCPKEEVLAQLYAYIHSFFRVELVHTAFPESSEMTAYINRKLNAAGFTLTAGAEKLLRESMTEMSRSNIYDGYNTIRQLSQEIIYHILSTKDVISFTVTKNDVKEFSIDSEYMKFYKKSEETRKRIGF